ncbi:hypothetical protein HOLleu_29158 [Holothuria leucospilota]|uniref:Uncharacterized protein n=1 Tax=Holothuria leucospilota TaxID=206669 RepID=A0A9Q1H1H3_HOLLE|nr:hypothetical protein HOLleu_29158 [Holothuria leucospilota]
MGTRVDPGLRPEELTPGIRFSHNRDQMNTWGPKQMKDQPAATGGYSRIGWYESGSNGQHNNPFFGYRDNEQMRYNHGRVSNIPHRPDLGSPWEDKVRAGYTESRPRYERLAGGEYNHPLEGYTEKGGMQHKSHGGV